MSPEEAKVLLDEWHVRLRDQEGALWEMADQLVRFPNPPPYPVRVSRDPLPPQYHPVTLVGQLPTNEIGITTNLLIPPFTRLVRRFFKISGFPVDSCEVGAAPDIGSGTSDIALLGAALSSDARRDYLKFLVEVKLLSPDVSLYGRASRSRDRTGSVSCPPSGTSRRGSGCPIRPTNASPPTLKLRLFGNQSWRRCVVLLCRADSRSRSNFMQIGRNTSLSPIMTDSCC